MRFILFVEGPTEQRAVPSFLKRWLDPKLNSRVGIACVVFQGCGQMLREIRKKAHMHLDGPKRDETIGVIGLLDLYGPEFYPAHLISADERRKWAVEKLEKEVDRAACFRMFFAVHEVEAWLLSDPALFQPEVRKVIEQVAKPEEKDFVEHPKAFLRTLYRQRLHREYKVLVDGVGLFAKLEPDVAYEKCPELKRMLDEMLRMAQHAGL